MRLPPRLVVAALLTLVAAGAGSVTWAAYTATTAGEGNLIEAGSVTLSDNDNGNSTLSLTAALPGATTNGCIEVRYTGSLAARVTLYGTTTGTGLDRYLDLKVTRGVYDQPEPPSGSCTNFRADGTDYIGAGLGVVYSGTLRDFPDAYASGIVDPASASPESWTSGEEHVYRMDVTLQNQLEAEGLTATQTFTWEARSQ